MNQRKLDVEYWQKLIEFKYKSIIIESCVHVWVLPLNISQSTYGGRQTQSFACTLITVQIAYDFLDSSFRLPGFGTKTSRYIPNDMLETLVNAIVDGNETHEKVMKQRRKGVARELRDNVSNTLTVPEAIQAHLPEMYEIDYHNYNGHFIGNLVSALEMVVTSSLLRHLNRIPIGVLAYEKSTCLIYDRISHSICLIDTHRHFRDKTGSVIISSAYDNLTDFVVTVVKCAFHEVFRKADLRGIFEISCLMLIRLFKKSLHGRIFKEITNCPIIIPAKKELFKIVERNEEAESDSDDGYRSWDDTSKRKSKRRQ